MQKSGTGSEEIRDSKAQRRGFAARNSASVPSGYKMPRATTEALLRSVVFDRVRNPSRSEIRGMLRETRSLLHE